MIFASQREKRKSLTCGVPKFVIDRRARQWDEGHRALAIYPLDTSAYADYPPAT